MNRRWHALVWQFFDRSILQWILLILSISVLIWLMFRVRSWFREDEDRAAENHEMLLQFRDLRRQGDLSEAEYRSIKSQLLRHADKRLRSDDSIAHDRHH